MDEIISVYLSWNCFLNFIIKLLSIVEVVNFCYDFLFLNIIGIYLFIMFGIYLLLIFNYKVKGFC